MAEPISTKLIVTICLGVCSFAGTFLGVGVWIGKKNKDSEEITQLKAKLEEHEEKDTKNFLKIEEKIEENAHKCKSRLFAPDGSQLYMSRGQCQNTENTIRAEISSIKQDVVQVSNTQHQQALTLQRVDSNVALLVKLFQKYEQSGKS